MNEGRGAATVLRSLDGVTVATVSIAMPCAEVINSIFALYILKVILAESINRQNQFCVYFFLQTFSMHYSAISTYCKYIYC